MKTRNKKQNVEEEGETIMKKEQLTQEELALVAVSMNAKITELEDAVAISKEIGEKKFIEEYEQKLQEVRHLQQKLYRMYKFK